MTEFGLKLRGRRGEPLVLEDELQIPPDVIRALTNFQVDAIRFLWKRLKSRQSCIFNDGNHMGKRITIGALIASLLRFRNKTRILIGCDADALPTWLFKLQVFMQLPRCKLFSGTGSDDPIVFVNTSDCVDWKELLADNLFTMIVLDIPSTTRFRFSTYLSTNFVTVICSADVTRRPQTALLEGFLKCFNYSNWYSNVLRRTNEQHLREFPWLDQNMFAFKYQQWKGWRTARDIFLELNTTPSPNMTCVEMSALLFETDDEDIPLEQEVRLPPVAAAHSSLLGSMYLRISQSSFANNTPKQKITASLAVQDSPDLFASLLDTEEDDIPNDCKISTPKSSQSPIRDEEPNCSITDRTLVNDVFDITANEVFANRIKVTASQNLQPVEVNDEDEQLKFDTPEVLLRTPTRKSSLKRNSVSPCTPRGWLSKRTVPNRTPEKLLVKKRRSLVQFYNSNAESRNESGSLDLSTLDDNDDALVCLKDDDL